jgi:hypothetical protein
MHNAAPLAYENANLRAANEKKNQKRKRSTRQIAHDGGLSVEEGIQLAQQLNQLADDDGIVSHAQAIYLFNRTGHVRELRLHAVGVGRLAIRLINVKIASLG